ncbi:MAG: glycerophosphodiester phosphodiesterase family protein [Gammaproteobacteria bacterium]|nr:glycerophosphodiester phosphodiesterase family protein [Gammaproteobacteria bacterium]
MEIPKLVGHRGYPNCYPENSIIGFEAAIRSGACYIETDIQLTSDLVPILFHDRTMDRACGTPGPIHQYTLTQLSDFQASEFDKFGYKFARNPINTLEELVRLLRGYPHVTAFIELKRISLEHFGPATVCQKVLGLLAPVARQCVVISYSLDALASVRNQGWQQIGAVFDHWKDTQRDNVRKLRPEYIFCDIEGLPRWGKIKSNYGKIAVFETVCPDTALRLARRGIEFVETYAIAEMLSAIKNMQRQQ